MASHTWKQLSPIRKSSEDLVIKAESIKMQGKVVWEGSVDEFDSTKEPIVRQFASGSLNGPIKYE